jgi:CRISPR-associated endonuclease Csn1
VFRKLARNGKPNFFFVPIYPHQVADSINWPSPPNKAILQAHDEEDWVEINSDYEFLFSLNLHAFVELTKSNGEIVDGYFKGIDRATGNIALALHTNMLDLRRGIGPKTSLSFRKFAVDRLGRKFEVLREVRTWRGKACT